MNFFFLSVAPFSSFRTIQSLGILTGAQLFSLNKEELCTVLPEEGARVYSQIMVQKSILEVCPVLLWMYFVRLCLSLCDLVQLLPQSWLMQAYVSFTQNKNTIIKKEPPCSSLHRDWLKYHKII